MLRAIVLVSCLIVIGGSAEVEKKDSVVLTLFYESYCPYSIDFIAQQLYPTWSYFKKPLQIDLVPYGNAKQSWSDGHFHFTCQHGPKECVGNVLHACAIRQTCGDPGTLHCDVPRLRRVLDYITCLFKQGDQQAASDKCAKKNGLDPVMLNLCANGSVGEWIESGYGNQTKAYSTPTVTYVPFIVINGVHNETMQDEAQTDLKGLVCKYIPKACH